MPQKISPFVEAKYGWSFGESGWNTGMDENLVKFSFLFDRNIDGITDTLPANPSNGSAYFLTTDSRLYFRVSSNWLSSPTPRWFVLVIRTTGELYQFDGSTLVSIESSSDLSDRIEDVELTLSTLGGAAFQNVEYFATQASLDVVEASLSSDIETVSEGIIATEERFEQELFAAGYEFLGNYTADLNITTRKQYFRRGDRFYAANGGTTLPYTTTGTWATDAANLVLLGDDVLRQELGTGSGASKVGFDYSIDYPTGSVGAALRNMSITITPKMFGYVGDGSPADAASFKAAAEYASANSLPFSAQGLSIVVTSALSISPDGAVDWNLEDTVLDFQLPSDVPVGLRVALQPGYKHRVTGRASFKFSGKAHTGVLFIQPTANVDGTEFHANGLEVFDTEMQVGAGVASAGLCVRGGFQLVRLRDCSATNIKMRPGAGVIGSNGITGILVTNHFGVTGAYARRTEIEGGSVSDVYSLDPAYQYDMDGIGVFANPVDTSNGLSSCEIQGVRFRNCWGRAIKSQTGRSHAEGIRIHMNTQPTGGCINPLVDFQTGSASASDSRAFLQGVNVLTLVAFQGTADSGSVVSTLDFADVTVDASATLREVVLASPLSTNVPMAAECRNITVRGAVQNIGRIGVSTFDTQSLHIENCIVTQLTQSLVHALSVSGGAAPYRALVSAKNCRNMTGSVPLVWSNDTGQTTRTLVGVEGTIRGFLRAPGLFNDSAVGATGGFGVSASPDLPEDVRGTGLAASGSRRLLGVELAAGEVFTLPAHGWNCYFATVTMGAFRTTACQVVVDADGATAVYAGTNTSVGLTTEPADGLLKVWGSGGRLTIKNASTSSRIVTAEFLG